MCSALGDVRFVPIADIGYHSRKRLAIGRLARFCKAGGLPIEPSTTSFKYCQEEEFSAGDPHGRSLLHLAE
jgi:hypothetical protein